MKPNSFAKRNTWIFYVRKFYLPILRAVRSVSGVRTNGIPSISWKRYCLNGVGTQAETPGSELSAAGFADEAMVLLLQNIRKVGATPSEYQQRIFDRGNMFPEIVCAGACHIGLQNVQMGRELCAQHGFTCESGHVKGFGHRYIVFDVWSGFVTLKHSALHAISPLTQDPIVLGVSNNI